MTDLGDFEEFESTETDSDRGVADGSPDATDVADPIAATDATDDEFESVETTPAGSDRGLGTLSAADGLSVGETEEDTRLRAYVTVGNRSLVRVGAYAVADYPDGEALFCKVTALEYAQEFRSDDATEIHARRAMRSEGIDEADYKFMATLEPLAVLYSEGDDLRRRMPDRVPKPETVVRQAADEAEVKTGLKVPGDGVFVGHLAVGGEKIRTAG
ncbi:AAA family ATPase, partial [Halobacteriales archaeon QS_9_67_17]